jgi:hypothetical protein
MSAAVAMSLKAKRKVCKRCDNKRRIAQSFERIANRFNREACFAVSHHDAGIR